MRTRAAADAERGSDGRAARRAEERGRRASPRRRRSSRTRVDVQRAEASAPHSRIRSPARSSEHALGRSSMGCRSLIDNDSHYHIGGRFLKGLLGADRIERVQGAPQRPPMRHPARCVNVLPEVIRLTVMIYGCYPFSHVRAAGDSTIGTKTRIRSANDERRSWHGSDRRKPFRHPRSSAPCFKRDSIRPSRLDTELTVLLNDRISRLIETVGRWSR